MRHRRDAEARALSALLRLRVVKTKKGLVTPLARRLPPGGGQLQQKEPPHLCEMCIPILLYKSEKRAVCWWKSQMYGQCRSAARAAMCQREAGLRVCRNRCAPKTYVATCCHFPIRRSRKRFHTVHMYMHHAVPARQRARDANDAAMYLYAVTIFAVSIRFNLFCTNRKRFGLTGQRSRPATETMYNISYIT